MVFMTCAPSAPLIPARFTYIATTMRSSCILGLVLVLLIVPHTSEAQSPPDDFKTTFMRSFNYSAQRMVRLAEAIPADKFSWSPGEGVMSIEHVYMHIAHYNYLYPKENLGLSIPDDIDMESLESITGKDEVVAHLRRSMQYVRETVKAMTDEQLVEATVLYGQDVQGWAVLFQLVAHMNEHVGQSIAYARMNGITPPWSQ